MAEESNRKVALRAGVPVLLCIVGVLLDVVGLSNAAGYVLLVGFPGALAMGRYVSEALLRTRLWWHYRGMGP